MPLLGKTVFDCPVGKVDPDTTLDIYTIPYTGESFTSEEQYRERLQIYDRKIWTCQCTGHINLSYQEAVESENRSKEMLAKYFPDIFEEPVLQITHHSSDLLDGIVNKSHKFLRTQLFVNEMVIFEALAGKKHDAKVVKVYTDANAEGTGSPSSDKENHTAKQSLITDMFNKTEKSPDHSHKSTGSSSEDSSSQTLEMSRLKYDILLTEENKVVRGVPAKTLKSSTKRPTRIHVKLFIRSNALRHEHNKQKIWIVDKAMVKKYNLVGKYSEELEKQFIKNSHDSIAHSVFINYKPRALVNGHIWPIKQQTGHKVIIGRKIEDSDSTNCNANLAPIFSPKVKFDKISLCDTPKTNGVSSDSISELRKSDNKNKLTNKRKSKDGGKSTPKKIKKKSSSSDIVLSDDDDDKPLSLLKGAGSNLSKASSRKNTSPKKKRQATLLELTKKKGGMMLMTSKKSHALGSSPSSSPAKKPRAPRQAPIVYMLLRLKKSKPIPIVRYRKLIVDAARMLTEKQRQNLPELVKHDILAKWEVLERKRKWDNMTIDERKQFRAAEREERNKKFEDMDMVAKGKAKPLPTFEPAVIPGNLPNTTFGDIAMVTEFLHSYKSLLYSSSREVKLSNHWALAEALSTGKKGYDSISHIMIHILYVLLSDDIARDYKELDFNINKVPITPEVCSELARICLRQLDDDLEEGNEMEDDPAKSTGAGISEEAFTRLLENEMYELEASDQLEVLCALTYRFLNTYTAQNYRDETKDKLRNVWRRLNKMRCENKQEREEEKKKQKVEKTSPQKPVTPEKTVLPETEKNATVKSQDLISRVKRRRIDAAERREQEEKERIKWEEERQKLFEKQEKEAEHIKIHKQLRDAENAAAKTSRLDPLGTDRHHNRYWLFSDNTPGLYIEKGWVQDYINYSAKTDNDTDKRMEDDIPLSMLESNNDTGPKETTIPHVGQNLWFVVNTKEKLDELIASLCFDGIREHQLKKVLKKRYNHILRSITKYEENLPKPPEPEDPEKILSPPPVTRKSLIVKDAEEDCKKSIKKRLNTIINDISKGGLSSIQDEVDIFIARVESAQEIPDFSTLMVDIFNAIDMRFFREYMSGITAKKNQSREELLPYEEKEKSENPKKIAKAELRREKWLKAVENATQYSRLSFLLTILHSSVMWEMYKYVRPKSSRSSSRVKNYAEMLKGGEDEDGEEEEEEEVEAEARTSSRSRRSAQRKKTQDSSDEEEKGAGTRRSRRIIKRKKNEDSSDDDEEQDAGRSPRRSSRKVKQKKVECSDEEEEEEDSEEGKVEEEGSGEEEDSEEEEEDDEEQQSENDEEENEDLERCLTVINRLLQYKCSNLFIYRVEEEDVPDYYEIVENPISLMDIKDKIEKANGSADRPNNSRTRSANRPIVPQNYTPDHLLDDFRLLVDNAEMYNGKDSFVWKQASKLKSAFCRCFLDNFRHSVRLMKKLKIFENPGDN